MDSTLIIEKLDRIEKMLEGYQKEILNVNELVKYTGFKKSQIYSLVHKNLIPFSKPNGKYLFFAKAEIDLWLLQNKTPSIKQITDKASSYRRSR